MLLLGLMWAVTSAAIPTGCAPLAIKSDESVIIQIDENAACGWKEISRQSAAARPVMQSESNTTQLLKGLDSGKEGIMLSQQPYNPPALAPDRVRFTMTVLQGSTDALLLIDNGYGRRLTYRAVMFLPNGRSMPTDVCQVMASKVGIEHWPYPIASLALNGFVLEDATPDKPLKCA